jgi:LysR family transcriptional regulator, glycine cleavage system transcriptional activator
LLQGKKTALFATEAGASFTSVLQKKPGSAEMRRLPPLNALRAFEVAARTGGFTLAANELSVSLGAVSRHIAHLEDVLGIKLFERRHRAVVLTAAGREYATSISAAFADVERATLRARERERPVRIRAFPNFVFRWLMPRVSAFKTQFPDIPLQFVPAEEAPLLASEPIDLSVHIHLPFQSNLSYERLFPLAIIPVCAPATAEKLGKVKAAEDLRKAVLLRSAIRRDDWKRWFTGAGCPVSAGQNEIEFANSSQAYEAAIEGRGIAIAQKENARDDLASARLVSPWPYALETGEAYYVAARKSVPSNVATFRDWMLASAH